MAQTGNESTNIAHADGVRQRVALGLEHKRYRDPVRRRANRVLPYCFPAAVPTGTQDFTPFCLRGRARLEPATNGLPIGISRMRLILLVFPCPVTYLELIRLG